MAVLPNLWSEPTELKIKLDTIIRVLVAESDPVSRRVICSILEREADVSFQWIDNSDVVAAIQDFSPDLVIVDAQAIPIRRATEWEGFGIKLPPATIVTAYDRMSLMPFASAAADLLIKPFNVEQFENAMEIARSKIAAARDKFSALSKYRDSKDRVPDQRKFLQRFAAESDGRIVLIKVQDVLWLQSFGNYVRVHSASAMHLVRNTMRNIQSLLDPNIFLRETLIKPSLSTASLDKVVPA